MSEAAKLAEAATRGAIEVGDFVLAYGDLAQVVEVVESDYAYRSYRVWYLAEKPKPDIQEDWFPARYVQVFHSRKLFFEGVERMVAEGRLPADIAERLGSLHEDEINAILRESMTNIWELGLREWVKKRAAAS